MKLGAFTDLLGKSECLELLEATAGQEWQEETKLAERELAKVEAQNLQKAIQEPLADLAEPESLEGMKLAGQETEEAEVQIQEADPGELEDLGMEEAQAEMKLEAPGRGELERRTWTFFTAVP